MAGADLVHPQDLKHPEPWSAMQTADVPLERNGALLGVLARSVCNQVLDSAEAFIDVIPNRIFRGE